MKFAVSTIALTAFNHTAELARLPALGIKAIEVAPSRIWRATWRGLTTVEVSDYRRGIEHAGVGVVGLHSLFYDHPELGLFKEPAVRAETLDFLEHLSGVCRDLGGRTLIYGGGRRRGELALDAAKTEAVDFFGDLTARVESHGTCFCFEPLGPDDTDFIHSGLDSLAIVRDVASPALAVQLDAKALIENDEATPELFREVADHLVHFHANEPGLGVLGSTGEVDHAALGDLLREIGYEGYVSMEQRLTNERDPLSDIGKSAEMLKTCYADTGGHA